MLLVFDNPALHDDEDEGEQQGGRERVGEGGDPTVEKREAVRTFVGELLAGLASLTSVPARRIEQGLERNRSSPAPNSGRPSIRAILRGTKVVGNRAFASSPAASGSA